MSLQGVSDERIESTRFDPAVGSFSTVESVWRRFQTRRGAIGGGGEIHLCGGRQGGRRERPRACGIGTPSFAPPLGPCGENATLDELREENKRLRRQLRRAELEREILKKATAYFAKESL